MSMEVTHQSYFHFSEATCRRRTLSHQADSANRWCVIITALGQELNPGVLQRQLYYAVIYRYMYHHHICVSIFQTDFRLYETSEVTYGAYVLFHNNMKFLAKFGTVKSTT